MKAWLSGRHGLMIRLMTHYFHSALHQHFPKQDGFLLAGVVAQGFKQGRFTVAQRELYDIAANKGWVCVHLDSSRAVVKTPAAEYGLDRKAIAALICAGIGWGDVVNGRAACRVARTADGIDLEGFAVVPVVVAKRWSAAIDACATGWPWQLLLADGASHCFVGEVLRGGQVWHAIDFTAWPAVIVRSAAGNGIHNATLLTDEEAQRSHLDHLGVFAHAFAGVWANIAISARDDLGSAVDVVKGDRVTQGLSERDQAFCGFGGDGLSLLVVPNVALRTTHAIGKGCLRQLEPVSDCFNRVHSAILVALFRFVNRVTS